MNGKLQGQGAQFFYHQAITRHFSLGFSWFFMRVNSSLDFALKNDSPTDNNGPRLVYGPSDRQELDNELRSMFRTIGIVHSHADQAGFGDVDAYLRLGNIWKYTLNADELKREHGLAH